MARYAKPNVTIDELKDKILELAKQRDEDCDDLDLGTAIYDIIYSYRDETIDKDLSKIEFDCENVDVASEYSEDVVSDFEMVDGYPILWVIGGGDWEIPLAFVLYIDHNNKLRAYIPKDGNVYNHEYKSAYGNHDDADEVDDDYIPFDFVKMREDVRNRIKVKENK